MNPLLLASLGSDELAEGDELLEDPDGAEDVGAEGAAVLQALAAIGFPLSDLSASDLLLS